jgi:hypothetical protein
VSGAKYHHETDRISANVYGAKDNLHQEVVEFPANGTSGPFYLGGAGEFYENSERVEIIVRDRHQPSIVLRTIPLSRVTDYVIEPLSKRLLFSAPVASVDENLNPLHIRVTYEVSSGGPSFWMYGADGQVKINENLQLGASYARDENPENVTTLSGVTAVVKIGERSVATAELARSETDLAGKGEGMRFEWLHDTPTLKVRAQGITTDAHFDNPSYGFGQARTEATLGATYQLTKATALRGEAIYSEDKETLGERKGILGAVSTRLTDMLQGEIGMRASEETAAPAQLTAVGATPNDLLTVRGRLGARLPWVPDAQAFVEAEQDVRTSDKHMAALGGDYQINGKTRLYSRYEFISSLGSPFALNDVQTNNVGVVGLESGAMTDARLFNEYRLRDTINGRESLAASGIRKTWQVADGLRLGGSFEKTKAFGGIQDNDATAITGSAEYTADPRYRVYGSMETRLADAGDAYLNTLGGAYKINKEWSMLARSAVSLQEGNGGVSSTLLSRPQYRGPVWLQTVSGSDTRTLLSRQQIGLAWRQVDLDRWNALGRYEYKHRQEDDPLGDDTEKAHIVSLHVNYQPLRSLIASGRYAFKWGQETYNDLSTDFQAHLVYARVTKDVTDKIDLSLQGACLWERQGAYRYALGAEVGYQLLTNPWISLGYNLIGFQDDDLTSGEYLEQGPYIRLRFKFDEELLQWK